MAEASLMALLEAMLSLAARPALMRQPAINIKAGGHPEELFLDLTEKQKEEYECSICYQVLKEVMECRNKHRFCYSCIQVWSTSGEYLNRIRCPVCRCEGHYSRNADLDEKIELNRVKCSLDGCSWKGLLKYSSTHKHSNYQSQNSSNSNSKTPNLPPLNSASNRPPPLNSATNRLSESSSSRPVRQYYPRSRLTLNNLSSLTGDTAVTAELTNNSTIDNEPVSPIIPAPPRTPRPTNLIRRRIPTLPSIVHNANAEPTQASVAPASTSVAQSSSGSGTGLLSRRRASQEQAPTASSSNRGNLTTVHDRLVESRHRLEGIVSTFSPDEPERRVQEFNEYHEERESNRQQQLEEVQELGRRLGQVARELRELLDHRRVMSNDSSDSDN